MLIAFELQIFAEIFVVINEDNILYVTLFNCILEASLLQSRKQGLVQLW